MAVPVYQSDTNADSWSGTPSVSYPSGTTSGDFVLVSILGATWSNGTPAISAAPSGYTLSATIDSDPNDATNRMREWLYYRKIDGSEGSTIDVTLTGVTYSVLSAHRISGASAVGTAATWANNAWNLSRSLPGLTIANNETLVFATQHHWDTQTDLTSPPSGWTESFDRNDEATKFVFTRSANSGTLAQTNFNSATIGTIRSSIAVPIAPGWAGSSGSITVTGTSGSFVPGTRTWTGSSGTITVTGSSGLLTSFNGYESKTFHLYLEIPDPAVNSLWDDALWDLDVWDNPYTYVDLWPRVRSGNVSFGPKRIETSNPASAVFTLSNNDGSLSPANPSGPYFGLLHPWRRIVLEMEVHDPPEPFTKRLFTGYVTNWHESMNSFSDAVITLTCTDELGNLARRELDPIELQGEGETTAARVQRILARASVPLTNVNIGTTTNTVMATTLSNNTTDELRKTAEAEGCDLWVDAAGVIQFPGQGNVDQLGNPYIIFTDDINETGDVDTFVYGYSDFQSHYETLSYGNVVIFSRQGSEPPGALVNEDSVYKFERKTFTKSDLICETDFQVLTLAQRWLSVHGEPRWYVESLTVPIHADNTYWSLLTVIQLGTAVTVRREPTPGYVIQQDCYVDAYSLSFNSDTTWFMTLSLVPVIDFAEGL